MTTQKFSRKKRDNKTKQRSRSHVKRGGMTPISRMAKMPNISTWWVHTVAPLLATTNTYITGHNPQASDHSITKYGERYYQTFADVPIDSGTKETIRNLKEEWTNTTKNMDKIKTLYDKIMETVEDEKRKQQEKERRMTNSIVTTPASTFTSPSQSSPLFVSGQQMSTPLKIRNTDVLQQFIKPPFDTPNTSSRPEYSSSSVTPAKPRPKSKSQLINDEEGNDEPQSQLSTILFNSGTPLSSPLPFSARSPNSNDNKKDDVFSSPIRALKL